MTNDLADSIAGLYAVFARYPKPATLPGCPCCVEPADSQALSLAPLQ